MALALLLDAGEVSQLRQTHYNAQIVERTDVHDELAILRVRPDHGITEFAPGQYSVIGLGNWESRLLGCEEEHLEEKELRRIVKRAYSFSCSISDGDGRLRRPAEFPYFEFYVVLVRHGEEHPPGLTPRLFALQPGDRLFVGPKATGHYTLDSVQPDDNVVLVATGTGEAPHNVMVAHLLSTGHRGQIVTITCARQRRDLGYAEIHRQLELTHGNYRYLTLTTREPENLDASHHDFVGKRYLQDYFESGEFEHDSGVPLDPQRTHVFLCGNPAMIGAPRHDVLGGQFFPTPVGMIEILSRRGFRPMRSPNPETSITKNTGKEVGNMLLKDVLEKKTKDVHTISSNASADEVVTELVRFNIGSLLVRDSPGGPILGIITERDILWRLAAHVAPLEQLRVGTCMSCELITAQPEDDIMVAMRLMTTHRVRHVPVVHRDQLHGIVSIGDIVKAHHDELELENYLMQSYIQGGGSAVVTPLV